jgi:ketosteroid isomerase-like protein
MPSVSQNNVDLVRRGVEDVERFWAMLDEHVVWDLRAWATLDLDSVYAGREAVINGTCRYWGAFTDYSVEIEEIIDGGSAIFVLLRERGRGKGSGAPVERDHAQVWTFRRGRIVRWESFENRDEALEVAGLTRPCG